LLRLDQCVAVICITILDNFITGKLVRIKSNQNVSISDNEVHIEVSRTKKYSQ